MAHSALLRGLREAAARSSSSSNSSSEEPAAPAEPSQEVEQEAPRETPPAARPAVDHARVTDESSQALLRALTERVEALSKKPDSDPKPKAAEIDPDIQKAMDGLEPEHRRLVEQIARQSVLESDEMKGAIREVEALKQKLEAQEKSAEEARVAGFREEARQIQALDDPSITSQANLVRAEKILQANAADTLTEALSMVTGRDLKKEIASAARAEKADSKPAPPKTPKTVRRSAVSQPKPKRSKDLREAFRAAREDDPSFMDALKF